MAVVSYNPRVVPSYIGLAGDTKPTTAGILAGAQFYETDSLSIYIYDGTAWNLMPALGGVVGGGGAVTVANGADVTQGALADAVDLVGGATTVSSKLRGIVQLLVLIKALLPTALAAHGGLKVEGVASGVAIPVSSATLALEAGGNLASVAASLRAKSALNVTDTADHIVKNGAGTLASVVLNTAAGASTLRVYDGTTAGGTLLATIDGTGVTPQPGLYNIACAVGIFVKATGTANWTVTYL
jgi:hypothetical protein